MNPKQNISILGCGWLGFPLAKRLLEKDYSIKGSTTSQDKLEGFKSAGIEPFLLNISDKKVNQPNFFTSEILIVSTPSKTVANFETLVKQIEKYEIKKVIFISSTSVYSNNNDIVTEDATTIDSALFKIENLFKNNNSFKTTILRFGGLIGYDRQPGSFHKEGAIIDNPEGTVNLIHRDDCIQIIEKIIEGNIWNETFNACADAHPTRREFYTLERLKLNNTEPVFNEVSQNKYKVISSNKVKNKLTYDFIFSDLKNI